MATLYPLSRNLLTNLPCYYNTLITLAGIGNMTNSFPTWTAWKCYLDMKPPLSHLRRASVASGKSNSGRWRTSTRTDNSAWTKGFNWSSSKATISYTRVREDWETWAIKLYDRYIRTFISITVYISRIIDTSKNFKLNFDIRTQDGLLQMPFKCLTCHL